MVPTLRMWPVGLGWTCLSIARRSWSSVSSPPSPLPLRSRMLLFLVQHFHDIEAIVSWSSWLGNWTRQRKNVYYSYAQKQFGSNVAAAFYILNLKGGFRLAGQSDWVRPNAKGKFSLDFINFSDLSIEEVDASGTVINYMGLNNLVSQQKLRCLSLRGCPEVDDWFLSRLHIFKDSLEELDLSGCSRVSVGGLSALHHLRKLRKLDLSSLPRVQNPGLVRILLEEVLPHCHIMGVEYQEGLQSSGAETDIKATSGL
ncbi:distal membrane-arm assembly complex protein 2 [Paramormyrops kingsleyae]|uniref:distal membrane-arm assembly complex protein 2 n=1 Tax=Paramormyrops kingsleyae TaxID=1676925 RepID=UPI003B97BF24